MTQTNKQDRLNQLRRRGIEGSMSRSESGSEEARARRAAQRELDWIQRFSPDQFDLDDEDRIALRITANPAKKVDVVLWGITEDGTGHASIIREIGVYVGPALENNADESVAHWKIPKDLDRAQPAKVTLGVAQRGADADAYTLQVEAFAYIPGSNGVTLDSSPTATFTETITTTTSTGDDHAMTFTLEPAMFFAGEVKSVIFRAIATTHPTATDLVLHHTEVEYTPLHYHTHE